MHYSGPEVLSCKLPKMTLNHICFALINDKTIRRYQRKGIGGFNV